MGATLLAELNSLCSGPQGQRPLLLLPQAAGVGPGPVLKCQGQATRERQRGGRYPHSSGLVRKETTM